MNTIVRAGLLVVSLLLTVQPATGGSRQPHTNQKVPGLSYLLQKHYSKFQQVAEQQRQVLAQRQNGKGKKPKPKPTPTVTVTASPTVVQYGQQVQLTATVSGAKRFSVKWSQYSTGLVGSGSFEPSSTVPNPKWTVVPVDQRATVTFFASVTAIIAKKTQTLTGSTTVTVEPAKMSEVKASPAKVQPGDWVKLSVTITGSGGVLPEWTTSNPKYQQGFEQGNRGTAVSWKAQPVNQPTTVDFIAKATIAGFITIQVSTSVTVEPVVVPPDLTVLYPQGYPFNVVAVGILLPVQVILSPGINPVAKLEAIVEGRQVAVLDNPVPGLVTLDVPEFGLSLGVKNLTIRATDTQGVYADTQVEIRHDPQELEKLAKEFLRKHCIAPGDGRLVRFGDLISDLYGGPYVKPIRVYPDSKVVPYIDEVATALGFWTKYTGIRFEIFTGTIPSDPGIWIDGLFDRSPGRSASAGRGGFSDVLPNSHRVTTGVIALYAPSISAGKEWLITVVAHEIGHIVLTTDDDYRGHTADGGLMDPGAPRVLHPYHQRAAQLLYQANPGDLLPP